MNNEDLDKYLKIFTNIKINNPFSNINKDILDGILNNIHDEIIKEVKKSKDTSPTKDTYIIHIITSFYSLANIYNKNYLYLENEFELEKILEEKKERYYAFKARTPDINYNPIYIIVSIDKKRETITNTIESKNIDFLKIIIYFEKNNIFMEIFSQLENFEDDFGLKFKLQSIKEEYFKSFLSLNIKFFEDNKQEIYISNIHIKD